MIKLFLLILDMALPTHVAGMQLCVEVVVHEKSRGCILSFWSIHLILFLAHASFSD